MKIKKTSFLLAFSFLFFTQKNILANQESVNPVAYVNILKDFETHTTIHIKNVTRLGMYLFYQYRFIYFKDVPENVLRQKLLIHDYEKLAPQEYLQELGYKNERPFNERLFSSYGKKQDDSLEIKNLIQELSGYTIQINADFFRNINYLNEDGSLNEIAKKIMLIEKIADTVEREKNPVSAEEFGRKMTPASSFFSIHTERALARQLAIFYPQIIWPNPLIYNTQNNLRKQTCSALF